MKMLLVWCLKWGTCLVCNALLNNVQVTAHIHCSHGLSHPFLVVTSLAVLQLRSTLPTLRCGHLWSAVLAFLRCASGVCSGTGRSTMGQCSHQKSLQPAQCCTTCACELGFQSQMTPLASTTLLKTQEHMMTKIWLRRDSTGRAGRSVTGCCRCSEQASSSPRPSSHPDS